MQCCIYSKIPGHIKTQRRNMPKQKQSMCGYSSDTYSLLHIFLLFKFFHSKHLLPQKIVKKKKNYLVLNYELRQKVWKEGYLQRPPANH